MRIDLLAVMVAVRVAELVLPTPSPPATVSQVAGLTRITVAYHSTAASAHAPNETALPAGGLWLIGDQGAPIISFSKEVVLAGTAVPPGSYSLLAVPSAGNWTLILNRRAPIWRRADRDPAQDVARVIVPAEGRPRRDRLAFLFSDFSDQRATLDLEWDRVKVRLPIDLETEQQVARALQSLDDTWRDLAQVSRFMQERKKDREGGQRYADQSLALRPRAFRAESPATVTPARLETVVVPTETTGPDPVRERQVPVRAPAPTKPPAAAAFAPIIGRGLPDLRRCYDRALRRDPGLALARLTLSIAVGPSGRVTGVSVTPPPPSAELDACLKATVTRWAFPPSPTEYETLVPLVLRGHS